MVLDMNKEMLALDMNKKEMMVLDKSKKEDGDERPFDGLEFHK